MWQFFFLLAAILLIGVLIPQLLIRGAIGSWFRVFVVPGVILHELSHALACFLVGAKIHRIRLFKKTGGDVTHESSKIPIVGPLIIPLGPLIIGFLVSLWIGHRLLPFIHHWPTGLSLTDFPSLLWLIIRNLNWHSITTWVWLYLLLSIGATMTPSWKDFYNSLFSLIVLVAIVYFLHKWINWSGYLHYVIPILTLLLFVLSVSLVFSLVIYLISLIFVI